MRQLAQLALLAALITPWAAPWAQQATPAAPLKQAEDPELASSLGGNDDGMRSYVLVLLKTGPKKMEAGPERTRMFEGHFANINKLASEKKLALAGPLDGVNNMRGLFVLATSDIEEAKKYVAADPVIIHGEMVAEYHKFYGSAGLMAVNDIHNKIRKK
ncbi:hypothetical protein KY495_18440 [Massilia sp. PAMC28688]|uniref:YciI family protein n=1 Tax=Massilia sp. PAMC28688 TaxID=2861283 RepID=UPI001C632A74|nr:hypothetical protein [Massilia sp. PAMC28688]QYF92694.1 hypothetical protein KY495_18440 [Massilia sp. PAMC28688]